MMRIYSSFLKAVTRVLSTIHPPKKAGLPDIYYCYRLLLRRSADSEGLCHWSRIISSGMTPDQLANAFLASSEFQHTHSLRNCQRVDTGGFIIYVNPDDATVASAIIRSRIYETHMTNFLQNLLRPDDVFLDIGCNIGWFTLLAAALAPQGKVIGIEPNHENLQYLYHSLIENAFTHVRVFPYAVTDQRALFQLSGHASYGFVQAFDGTDAEIVQGVPIDELVSAEPRIDVIKIDIEGHEPIALQGMQRTIHTHHPLLLFEFHPVLMRERSQCEPLEYLTALSRMGYRFAALERTGQEVAFQRSDEVMTYWQRLNGQCASSESIPLDLIGRAAK